MPDLNCTEFEARLAQAVEDRQSLGDGEEGTGSQSALWRELRARANACPHCRQLWNEFALLERVLPAWKSQLPQVHLTDAVMARWREEQSSAAPQSLLPQSATPQQNHRPKSNGRSLLAVVMVAAVAVLAGFPLLFPSHSQDALPTTFPIAQMDEQPGQDKSGSSSVNGPLENEIQTNPDWRSLAQDAGSAYWVLASDAADSFASVTVLVPPRKTTIPTPEPEAPKPTDGWVKGIGSGLKPIGQDVGKAMGFLFEVLPSDPPTI